MKIKEIAARIRKHLKRFEANPEINKHQIYDEIQGKYVDDPSGKGIGKYYFAGASVSGRWIQITYVAYQRSSPLGKKQALQYLEWLDTGNEGTYQEMIDEQKRSKRKNQKTRKTHSR